MARFTKDVGSQQFMDDLDNGRNVFGALDSEVRARLFAVAESPTNETWQAAHGILLSNQPGVTLWQALLKHTNYSVTAGPRYTHGHTAEWAPEDLPTSEQIVQAIHHATADQLDAVRQREAATFLRNTVANSPAFADIFTVVNIEAITKTTLVFDLSDGTTIRVDFERYKRDDS